MQHTSRIAPKTARSIAAKLHGILEHASLMSVDVFDLYSHPDMPGYISDEHYESLGKDGRTDFINIGAPNAAGECISVEYITAMRDTLKSIADGTLQKGCSNLGKAVELLHQDLAKGYKSISEGKGFHSRIVENIYKDAIADIGQLIYDARSTNLFKDSKQLDDTPSAAR